MSSVEERARAAAFLRAFSLQLAHRTELFPWGVALFEPRLPLVWHLNSVWVDAVPEGISATAFVAELERLQSTAALSHRQAIVADETSGDRLSPSLRELGWSITRNLLMAWRRSPDRPSAISNVREVDASVAGPFTARALRSSPEGFSRHVIYELAAAKTLLAEAGARFFGAAADGELASVCELYIDGDTARIGAVETLPEHRNKGLARAVIGRALAEARAAGCDLVFLEAEEQDWPKRLYAKLGFDPIGHMHEFTLPGSGLPIDRPEPLEYRSSSPRPSPDREARDGSPS